jgi:hypothetical protein
MGIIRIDASWSLAALCHVSDVAATGIAVCHGRSGRAGLDSTFRSTAMHGRRDGHWYLHKFNQPLVSHSMAVALLF